MHSNYYNLGVYSLNRAKKHMNTKQIDKRQRIKNDTSEKYKEK